MQCWIPLLYLLLLFSTAAAEEPEVDPVTDMPPSQPFSKALVTTEKTRDFIGRNLTLMTRRVDLFLGSKDRIEDRNETFLRWTNLLTYGFSKGYLFKSSVSAHLDLPNINRRLSLIIQSREDENDGSSINQSIKSIAQEQQDQPITASVQYIFKEVKKWRYTASLGFAFPDDPFARLRARKKFTSDSWTSSAAQSLTWHFENRWDALSTLEMQRQLDDKTMLQHDISLFWDEAVPDLVTFKDDLSLFYSVSKQTLFQYQIGFTCVNQPNTRITQYRVSPVWRKDIYEGWLFLSGGPMLQFDRELDWKTNHSLFVAIDIIFADDTYED